MLFQTGDQSLAFLLMLACGLRIGLCFDLLRLLRRLFQPGFLLSLALDLLFGAATAGLVILALVRTLDGEPRLYALMGALAGLLLYGATLSRLLEGLARRAARLARMAGRFLSKSIFLKKLFR